MDQLYYDEVQTNLPVFGLKRGTQSHLAVIESGAAIATVNANISGMVNGYNNVFASFALTQFSEMKAPYQDAGAILMVQEEPFPYDLSVCYRLLGDEDYIGMARSYQEYLLQHDMLQLSKNLESRLNLELLGTVNYTGSVLGVPVTKHKKLTTFEQARTIVETLREKGVKNISLNYEGWADNGVHNDLMTNSKPENVLGGKKALAELNSWLNSKGIAAYYKLNIQSFYKDRAFDNYHSMQDAPKNILGEIVNVPVYNFASKLRDTWTYIVKPDNFKPYTQKGIDRMKSLGLKGAAVPTLGNMLYTDFNKGGYVSRDTAARYAAEAIASMKNAGLSISLKAPNAYALASANEITDLPNTSNQFYLTDQDVPFYQAVLHGIVPYSLPALNQSNDWRVAFLQSVEYGANPAMKWMYAPNKEVKGILNDGFLLYYRDWIDRASELYARFTEFGNIVGAAKMKGHERLSKTLAKTVYDNGYAVYVNYAKTETAVGTKIIPAQDFVIVKEG